MVHVVESVINRKYGGWFIRNTEHAQRVYDALKASPLPIPKPGVAGPGADGEPKASTTETKSRQNAPWAANSGPRKVEFAA